MSIRNKKAEEPAELPTPQSEPPSPAPPESGDETPTIETVNGIDFVSTEAKEPELPIESQPVSVSICTICQYPPRHDSIGNRICPAAKENCPNI
jgi:hypothetical protein